MQFASSAQPVFFSITWTYLEICRVNLKFKASLPNPYIEMQMCTLDIKKIKSVPICSNVSNGSISFFVNYGCWLHLKQNDN